MCVGKIISHTDFHDGPMPSNLCDGTIYGHHPHSNVHVWTRIERIGPTTKNLWSTHMAQLKMNNDQVKEES